MFHTCDVKSGDRNPYVFTMTTMAAKNEFYENRKKIRFADITVISSKGDITYYKETVEKVKQTTTTTTTEKTALVIFLRVAV